MVINLISCIYLCCEDIFLRGCSLCWDNILVSWRKHSRTQLRGPSPAAWRWPWEPLRAWWHLDHQWESQQCWVSWSPGAESGWPGGGTLTVSWSPQKIISYQRNVFLCPVSHITHCLLSHTWKLLNNIKTRSGWLEIIPSIHNNVAVDKINSSLLTFRCLELWVEVNTSAAGE